MKDLKKQVSVTINTVQRDEDGKSEINVSYDGTMYLKDGIYYIFYSEYSDDGEKTADCRIKCGDGSVEIKRSGAYSSRLSFETGKTYKSVYGTPYGGMPVVIKTKRVLTAIDNDGGKIYLEYFMSLGGRDFNNVVTTRVVTK